MTGNQRLAANDTSPGGPGQSARARRRGTRLEVEPLEGRLLLTGYTGFSRVRNLLTSSGIYNIRLSGPGVIRAGTAGKGTINLNVLGTTTASSLSFSKVRAQWHTSAQLLAIRNLTINSGQIGAITAGDVALNGPMTPLTTSVNTLQFGALGPRAQIDVRGDVTTFSVKDVNLGPTGHVKISGDLNNGAGSMTLDTLRLDGGRFIIGRDSLAPIRIESDVLLTRNGLFKIGRDQLGSFSVIGSLVIDTGSQLFVGRDMNALGVDGDVVIKPGSTGIAVGGNMNGFLVNGIFRGQGSQSAIDMGVGLNLNDFTVRGYTANLGGIQSANIDVGKSINGMTVDHGIYRSWITAGVSINGLIVGPDGNTAILNSELDAVSSITAVTANGDVVSDFPTNPNATGYPTRIVAGKTRAGKFHGNGLIDGFSINGNLVDSVFAASVAPYGGDGTLPPPTPYYGGNPRIVGPPPGDVGYNTYDAPAGVTGQGSGQIKNYSIRSTGVPTAVWDTTVDPTIDDTVLENGTVNLTLTGTVISTTRDDRFDFAGIFAVNTAGVNGGPLP